MRYYRFYIIAIQLSLLLFYSCEKDKVEIKEYGSISGYVFDSETNDPLQNVNITTSPASTALITDANGYFYISEIQAGDVSISAKKNNYTSTTVTVSIKAVSTTNVIIHMSKSTDNVDIQVKDPVPADGSDNQAINVTLHWYVEINGSGIDSTLITYDVLIYESNNLIQQIAGSGITDTLLQLDGLKYSTAYFWQVVSYYDGTEKSRSDVWGFSTVDYDPLPFLVVKMNNGNYDIFGADTLPDTNQNVNQTFINLTDNIYLDWNPQFNHGGEKIAFASNRAGQPNIYIMDNDGSNVNRITSQANISYFNTGEGFCWSPDDEWILYSNYNKLYKIHKTGAFLIQIATAPPGREFRHCAWNGYTNKIVVQTISDTIYKSEFYIMDDDGFNMQLLVADEPGRIDHPSFSITGSHIIFTKDDDGFNSVDGRQLNAHIYSLQTDSLILTDLSTGKIPGTNDLFPRFSTDGAKIIFVNTSNTGIGPKSVYVMETDGTSRTLMFNESTMPDWFE